MHARVCEQGLLGTGHSDMVSAVERFPSRPDLQRWVLAGALPMQLQPSAWLFCGGSRHCPGAAWCCRLFWLQLNNKCIY